MASQVTNYQCPACTGPLHFVGSSGKLECDYCGTVYNPAEIEELYAQKNAQAEENFTQTAEQEGTVGGDDAVMSAGRVETTLKSTWDASTHYSVRRAGRITFSGIPTDASKKMPDDLMDSLEPYDYRELKPFSAAYLPGYLADRYDVSVEDSAARADNRCINSIETAMRADVIGYESVVQVGGDVQVNRGQVHYALLPVWILKTKWNGNDYLFAMNGQTGKFVGNLPVSRGRFWSWFAGLTLGTAAVLYLTRIAKLLADFIGYVLS